MFIDITSITFAKGTHNLSKEDFYIPLSPLMLDIPAESWIPSIRSLHGSFLKTRSLKRNLFGMSLLFQLTLSWCSTVHQLALLSMTGKEKKKRERNNNIIICQHLIHAHNEPRSQFRVITWDAPRKWPRNSFLGHMLYGCPCSFPGKESCAFSPIWVLKKPLGVLNYDNQMAKSLHFSPRF